MRKTGSRIGIFALLLLLALSFTKILLHAQSRSSSVSNEVSSQMPQRSKAEIIEELKAIKKRIEDFEEDNGLSGADGFKIYSPEESGKMLQYYKELRTGLEYLNRGKVAAIDDWEGYALEERGGTAYGSKEAFQVLNELDGENLPPALFTGFRVYLLPVGMPEISGLGGAGFAMIAAPDIKEKSIEQLRVTLLHELGHHLHSSFMPSINGRPNRLWEVYHKIRGGRWRGPGKVNTQDWSSSSEETFAEDFRLLFGKDQWYYGDIVLGDPRVQPGVVAKLKRFMIGLPVQAAPMANRSPWIPEGLEFWLKCQYYIYGGWAVIIMGLYVVSSYNQSQKAKIRGKFSHSPDASEAITGC